MVGESDSLHFRNRERTTPSSSTSLTKSDKNGQVKDGTLKGGKMFRPTFSKKILLALGVFVLLFFSVTFFTEIGCGGHKVTWWDENVHLRFGFQKKIYAVVIDAGSTGTRVLAFEFNQATRDNSLKLKDEELFAEVKPGLSFYAEEPKNAAKSVELLLGKAKDFIPKENWGSTPVSLKATAGLRLLPKEKADAILEEVSKVIQNSGFVTNAKSVEIMDGVDEGIFSWFSVNFLLDRIGGPVSKTVVALDLGGGSTQITVATSPDTLSLYPKEDIKNISLFHRPVSLFTYSYLGLGLQSVRKSVLTYNNTTSTTLLSPCVNPAVTREWAHAGITYTIKGIENGKFEKVSYDGFVRKEPVADWEECHKIIIKLIEEKKIIKSKDLNRQIVVFSYFFERAAEAGLVDPVEGGKLTLQNYLDAGKKACRTVNAELPLLCLDVTFMGALLHNGYGLAKHTPLLALKKVHGHEISWALGLAYHNIQNGA